MSRKRYGRKSFGKNISRHSICHRYQMCHPVSFLMVKVNISVTRQIILVFLAVIISKSN